jgi:hypothetical protein
MLPSTIDRVPAHTPERANAAIRRETEERVHYYARNPHLIGERLEQLDREWDIERMLEANAAVAAFTGVALAVTVDKRWLALPALVAGFLFQHALQGWCPPLPVLRAKGFRTSREIETERNALKALRGDFDRLVKTEDRDSSGRAALDAARL